MYDHVQDIVNNIISEQLEEGHLLAERFFRICQEFRGFDAPNFDIDENTALLNDLLEFEKNICSLEFLYMFYGYIARMYLQTGNAENSIIYGQDAVELNERVKDTEGVRAANNVLGDCAFANDSALVGVEFFEKAQPRSLPQIEHYKKLPNHNAHHINKLLKRKKRPSTFKYFESPETQKLEESIRLMMVAQGCTRATSKRYCDNLPS
ncbi:hypothetical protein [Alteromonas gracilis]|uniref:hypothetical protein n=1 Tax=Alteromonas gracilis TaxID=1479524 RepID=UPI003736C53F